LKQRKNCLIAFGRWAFSYPQIKGREAPDESRSYRCTKLEC
jgi:hypothetical protein